MKVAKYLLSTLKFYAQTIFCSVVFILVSLLFVNRYSQVTTINQTLNNTSCSFVAYDNWIENSDTYEYYDNKIDVYVNDSESLLNVLVGQFIDDNEYTSYSYVNEKNTVLGKYKILEKEEAGLPISFKEKLKINLNSNVYVDGSACRVVYFYNDVYQIQSMEPSVPVQFILVGKKTISKAPESYLKFNPSYDTKHVKLYSVENHLKKTYRNSLISLSVLLGIIYLATSFVIISYFKIKRTRNMINRSIVNGETNQYAFILLIELLFLVFTLAILATFTLWNVLKLFYLIMAESLLINSLINFVSFSIYTNVRKKDWKK